MMKGKSWTIRKLDPEDDLRVDLYWEGLSMVERVELATMEKHSILNQIKKKLRRRCTCPDCKFSKISYFDPQSKLIDAYIQQLENNGCTCHRRHRDFSDDDHKEVDYIDNPTCQAFDTLITSKIFIRGDKLCISPDVLTDDFFKIYRQQRYWRMLTPSPPPPASCCAENNPGIANMSEPEKAQISEAEEKHKPKETCDECRSRINFEIHIASALEERVTLAQRAKVLELQSQVVCEMLLKEEASKKSKRTAGSRAHHHHCTHHKASPKSVPKRRKAANQEANKNSNNIDEEVPEVRMEEASMIYDMNQVLILDNAMTQAEEEDFASEDWTVVGKTGKEKKKTEISTPNQVVPESNAKSAPKVSTKTKNSNTAKPKTPPSPPATPTPTPTPAPAPSKSTKAQTKPLTANASQPWKTQQQDTQQQATQQQQTQQTQQTQRTQQTQQVQQAQQIQQTKQTQQTQPRPTSPPQPAKPAQTTAPPPRQPTPPQSTLPSPPPILPPTLPPTQTPSLSIPPQQTHSLQPSFPTPEFSSFEFPSLLSVKAKAVQPPPTKPKTTTITPKEVRDATQVLVSAIKAVSSSSFSCASSPSAQSIELRNTLIESLRTLSLVGEGLMDSSSICTPGCAEQICCEEECCMSPLHDEDCPCVYHTNCFSLPMIFESSMWDI